MQRREENRREEGAIGNVLVKSKRREEAMRVIAVTTAPAAQQCSFIAKYISNIQHTATVCLVAMEFGPSMAYNRQLLTRLDPLSYNLCIVLVKAAGGLSDFQALTHYSQQ